jgi:hypothetical protein
MEEDKQVGSLKNNKSKNDQLIQWLLLAESFVS